MEYGKNIDLSFDTSGIPLQIYASQYDTARVIYFTYDGLTDAPSKGYAEFTKPDGLGIILELTSVKATSCTLTMSEQLLAVAGKVRGKIKLEDESGSTLCTRAIEINVDKAGVDDDTIFSDSDLNAVLKMADTAKSYAKEASSYSDSAKKYAESAESAKISVDLDAQSAGNSARLALQDAETATAAAATATKAAETAADDAISTLEGKVRKILYSTAIEESGKTVASVTAYSELGRTFIEYVDTPNKAADSLAFTETYGSQYYHSGGISKSIDLSTYISKIGATSIKSVIIAECQPLVDNALIATNVRSVTVAATSAMVNAWIFHPLKDTKSVVCMYKLLVEVE